MTEVVNIYHLEENWRDNPDYVYIGRAGKGFSGEYGNPFVVGTDGTREEVLVKYTEYFYSRITDQNDPFFWRIKELRDKKLVCFCKPKVCHGDVIAEFLNNPANIDLMEFLDEIGASSPVVESPQNVEEYA